MDSVENNPTPSTLTAEQMDALIAKHADQINAIFSIIDPQAQKQAVQALGINTDALENHYKGLEEKNKELQRLDASAGNKTIASGLAGFMAGFGGMAYIKDKISANKLVQWTTVAFVGLLGALAGAFFGSRIFSGWNREESKKLVIDASNALKRELAIALENKEIEAQQVAPSQQVPTKGFTTDIEQRDPNFVAQAAAEKAVAANTVQQHG